MGIILKKEAERCGMHLQVSRYSPVAGSCEKSNGLSGSIKVDGFRNLLQRHGLFRSQIVVLFFMTPCSLTQKFRMNMTIYLQDYTCHNPEYHNLNTQE
jgi:hypothetical protein